MSERKVEGPVAPTNFQDKGVNNGPGNRWLVFDRCRNDGFQSLADNNARCRWFINPRIVANLKALWTTGPGGRGGGGGERKRKREKDGKCTSQRRRGLDGRKIEMKRDRFYLTYSEREKERERGREGERELSARVNPLEILKAEALRRKDHDARRREGGGRGRGRGKSVCERRAGARKWWRELESRVKALRAL